MRISCGAHRDPGSLCSLGLNRERGKVIAAQTELRYERWYLALSVPLGLGPNRSEVRVEDGTLHVKMGWAF